MKRRVRGEVGKRAAFLEHRVIEFDSRAQEEEHKG